MSVPEIHHRVREKAKKFAAKNRLEGWSRYENTGPPPSLESLRAYVNGLDGDARREVAARAAEALSGRFYALGRRWPARGGENAFPADLWRTDPVTGELWPGPDRYCFEIPYRRERSLGDVKYVWEINRLQFLHVLAARAYLDDDDRAVEAIESVIASWFAVNPPFRGICWSPGIEVALRTISFLTVSTLVGGLLADETVNRIRAVLAASSFWLARCPSRFSSANNHAIAESAAEFLISLAMPELPRAAEAHKNARRTLEDEALKQFHEDGVPAEQSPSYGAFSAELLWLCHREEPLDHRVIRRLTRFAEFSRWLTDEEGRTPAIGDNDEGRVLAFAGARATYVSAIAERIACVEPPSGLRTFPDGGYTVVRQGSWHVVIDHGPLGYLSIAAHGHADALSLYVAFDGQPFLVDPGTYLYHSGGEDRDWFRGTPAHNTLNIASANQSTITGPFNWSHKATCRLEEAIPGPNWSITASHDGYEKRFQARHRRRVAGSSNGILIEDRLIGAPTEAEIVFQLAPEVRADLREHECRVTRAGRAIATIAFDARGLVHLDAGIVSPEFGIKMPAPRLRWRGIVDHHGVRRMIA